MSERFYAFDRESFDSIKGSLRKGAIVEFWDKQNRSSEVLLGEYIYSAEGMMYFKSIKVTNRIENSLIFPDYNEGLDDSRSIKTLMFRVKG